MPDITGGRHVADAMSRASKKEKPMNVGVVTGTRTVDAHRALTSTDLVLCVLPIAVFLSIVSLV